tara:strand:- start:1841 stop:2467 length:627 start_codon:yes stop_codon:yes gene_type:complete
MKETKDSIISGLFTSEVIEEIVGNITRGNSLKDDLKAELFLILCEMSSERILEAHNKKYLMYMCINILKKQYNSSTSPFHTKYRKNKSVELDGTEQVVTSSNYDEEYSKENLILEATEVFLRTLSVVDRELFKIYYKMDNYDRWIGENRDTTCTKNISSTRKIERKLALANVEGQKRITIDHSTVANSVKKTLKLLQTNLEDLGLKQI